MNVDEIVFLLNEIYRERRYASNVIHNPSYLHLLALQLPWYLVAENIEKINNPEERAYLRTLEEQYICDYIARQLSSLNLHQKNEIGPFEKAVYCVGLLHNPRYSEIRFFYHLSSIESALSEHLNAAGVSFDHRSWESILTMLPFIGSHTARVRAEEIIRHLNLFIFETLGIGWDENCFFEPASHAVQSFLEGENRKGIPISLSAFYIILAQRLKLPIYGVNTPRHFLVKWESESVEIFIDPSSGGRIIPRASIEYLLQQQNYPLNRQYFESCHYDTIIRRMLSNLSVVALRTGDGERAAYLEHLTRALPD